MIHVQPQPEPPDFDDHVRQPGKEDLAVADGALRPHWHHCAGQLWKAYRGVCAYSCLYIPRGTGARSVDHLFPKSKHRELTYEWSNYRLACSRMNSRKNAFEDVLDPFEVQDGWFVLNLSTLTVEPGVGLPEEVHHRVQETIDRLNLNDDEFIRAREAYYDDFREKHLDFHFLQRHFPLLAKELIRQGMVREAV